MIRALNFEHEAIFFAGRIGKRFMIRENADAVFHEPVLLRETVELLAPAPGKLFVDGTLGGGGHSKALVDAGATVIGLDQDPDALDFARKRIGAAGGRFQAVHANFADLNGVLDRLGIGQIDGGLLDIGVSSWQIDSAERGFSFMKNGPLDMRMNPDAQTTAADILNHAGAEQLEDVFRKFGEEPAARRIAAMIVRERLAKPFQTTFDLAQAVERVIPRHSKTHPATRVFQALRIAVNRELEVLEKALEQFGARLKPGARFGVITFHSLEDRIVKTFFKTRSAEWIDRPEWPAPRPNPQRIFKLVKTKPVVADEEEQLHNPRSRSAKLRIVEKL
jgi:16S rRNA (cytosine1402-N4)-methyltransferase